METTPSISRRNLFRMVGAGAASLAAVSLVGAREAEAARAWCRVDPVVLIDGQLADIFVGSDLRMLLSATGPIKMQISIPTGSKGNVVLTDLGFTRGYSISFVQTSSLVRQNGRTPVIVKVYAPAKDSSLPVSVNFSPRSLGSSLMDILFGMTADGTANSWVTLVR
jgi:hypothetical protein